MLKTLPALMALMIAPLFSRTCDGGPGTDPSDPKPDAGVDPCSSPSADGGPAEAGHAPEAGADGTAESDSGTACSAAAAVTDTTRIGVAGALDMVFDGKRCRVYVSAASGKLMSYDIRSGALDELADLGGAPLGIDLSPNQDTLIVADAGFEQEGRSWVHVLDLRANTARRVFLPFGSYGAGTFTAVFTSDQSALVTSSFPGSGWVPLRRLDVVTGVVESISEVRQDTMLTTSADRSVVAYAESNISSGEFGRYLPADGSFQEAWADWFVYEIAVNRDGTQYAVPTYGGLFIYAYDSGFQKIATLGNYVTQFGLGAAYSPISDVLYVAWMGDSSSIEQIDARSFEVLATIDVNVQFPWKSNSAFGSGRLKTSRDGKLLLAIVPNGLHIYPVARE